MAATASAEAGPSAPVPPLNSAAPAVDRMCAPTAVSRGLALYCNSTRTPEEVQRVVTGKEDPSAWMSVQFVAAV